MNASLDRHSNAYAQVGAAAFMEDSKAYDRGEQRASAPERTISTAASCSWMTVRSRVSGNISLRICPWKLALSVIQMTHCNGTVPVLKVEPS